MADYRAVAAVCEAVIQLLEEKAASLLFGEGPEFKVFSTQDFTAPPLETGISLFLYRIRPNGVYRTPPGRTLPNGNRQKHKLPLDLHFFLTAWARESSLQNTLAGWAMRVLEDHPILPTRNLNGKWDGVFRPDENVEILLDEMTIEEMFNLWEQLAKNSYQLSIPYLARIVQVDSFLDRAGEGTVLSREFAFYRPAGETGP